MADLDLTLTFRGDTAFLRQASKDIEAMGSRATGANQRVADSSRRSTEQIISDIKRQETARERLNRLVQDSANKEAIAQQRIRNEIDKSTKAFLKANAAAQGFPGFGAGARMPSTAGPIAGIENLFGGTAEQRGLQVFAATQAASLFDNIGRNASVAGRSVEKMAQTTTAGLQNVERSGRRAATSIRDMGRAGEFALGALGAFLFYRGFVFLSNQARMFVTSLVELEHEVAIVQTQLNDMGRDFQPLIRDRVIRTAQETGLAFRDVAAAQFEVVSANIDLADSFEILDLSAKAAVAGGLQDVELAFNAALSQVNAFNLSNEEFADVFDKQFNLVKRGIFTYEQFATVVGSVSESFATMGQDVETANAALAAISQVFTGRQLERGATGLRNAVLRISEARGDFEALGVAVVDANGEFRNFIDIGRDLNAVLEGLSGAARAEVIKGLFPDERERRGIQAFLGQLDEAQQFFVEQQFAAGDLEEAFQTVNDTLAQQANILRNDLTPAMDIVVDTFGLLTTQINGMNEAIPGFTRNVIALGVALTALRLGRGFLATPGGPGFLTATPTRLGAAAGIAGAGLGFAAGRQPGFAGADLAGSAIGGAAFGGMFGPQGALIGAAAGALAFGLGSAFEREAPPVAETFADRFSAALEARSGDVASAFADAVAEEALGGGTEFQALLQGQERFFVTQAQALMRGTASGIAAEFGISQAEAADLIAGDVERVALTQAQAARLRPSQRRGLAREAVSSAEVQQAFVDAFIQAQQEIREIPEGVGTEDQRREARLDRIDSALEASIDLVEDDQRAARGFIDNLLRLQLEVEQVAQVFRVFADPEGGAAAALELANSFQQATEAVGSFALAAAEFNVLVSGDFGDLVPIFNRMGTEGERVAEVFGRISQTVQAFELLERFQEFAFVNVERQAALRSSQAELNRLIASGAPFGELQAAGARVAAARAMPGERNVLESLGIDSAEAARLLTDRLLGDLGLVGGNFTARDFVDALLAETAPDVAEAIEEEVIPGATGLADALMEAGELVRTGLMDGLGFASEELLLMGEELREFNRLAAQRRILEELGAIAEFAGVNATGSIQTAFRSLAEDMRLAGRNFFDLLSDPVALSELLSNMEFGDVQVDNSQDFNFVVRVSGDVSESQLRSLEDSLVNAINKAQRQAASR